MRSLRKAYVFSFFWMFLVLIPIIVPYFQSLGLSMEQFFQLQAIYGIAFVLFELPTGYICDLWGRKRVLICGSFLSASAYTLLLWFKTFPEFVVYEILLAAGASLVSGADVSFLYDALEQEDKHHSHGSHALANLQLAQVFGESVASVLGGLLVVYSFAHVITVHVVVSWIPFLVALTLKESRQYLVKPSGHFKNIAMVMRQIFAGERMLRLISINLMVWGLSSFFAVWLYQKYWQDRGIPLSSFGFLWAGFNLAVGVSGKFVQRLKSKGHIGPVPLLVTLGLCSLGGYFGMGAAGGWIGVSFGLLFYISRGITNVFLKDEFNRRVSSQFRATANSMQTLLFRFGFGICGPAIGYAVDHVGISNTLLILGGCFTGAFLLFMLPLIWAFVALAESRSTPA